LRVNLAYPNPDVRKVLESDDAALLAILEQLKNILKQNADLDRPGGKAKSEGSLFNSSPTPLADRIQTCRDQLGLACQHILMNSPSY
jgi:hypothetical protein